MGEIASPLRYPGGKSRLAAFLSRVIKTNKMRDPVFAEPYAGGGGAALGLLFSEKVSRIILNDKDPCIFDFWRAILRKTDGFLDLLDSTPVTVEEWHRQRSVYQNARRYGYLRVGFATFFLNRCNRSGIIATGGPIGGPQQKGMWKIDARFNRTGLRNRIERIALYSDRIEVHNLDALDFLRDVVRPVTREEADCLVFLDPPYYVKGRKLYLNSYGHRNHSELARFLRRTRFFNWVLTYDDVPQIRDLYKTFGPQGFVLSYSAYERRVGPELLVHDRALTMPQAAPGMNMVCQS